MINKNDYLINLKSTILKKGNTNEYAMLCNKYAERLLDNNLPVIFDLQHFSLLLGIKKEHLSGLLYSKESKVYKSVYIPKKTGGHRELCIPTINLKYIQRWILDNILANMHVSTFSTGFKKNTSIVINASRHIGNECIINLDIKNFFPSIHSERIFRIFNYYGYTKQVAFILSKLCTYKNALPQGSPASPYLSNIACLKLDKRLSMLCNKVDANYSRYADDITISGNRGIEKYIPIVSEIVRDEGFELNKKKTRYAYKHKRQEITGLNINSGRVTVPQKYKRALKDEIYYCKKYGVSSHMEYKGIDKAFYKEHLYGKAYYVHMVEKDVGKKFLKQLDEIEWDY